MASVSEDFLNITAHQVVSGCIDDGVSLNDGVRKKASELGLNRDQTSRLIERTNSEMFLQVFPDKTEFEVADPNVIFGSSDKTASIKESKERRSYADYLERDPYEIFGIVPEKTASVDYDSTTRMAWVDKVYNDKLQDEQRVVKMAKLIAMEDAQNRLWDVFKTAACNGKVVADMECELLLAFPDKPCEVIETVSVLTDKLARDTSLPPEVMKRASIEGFDPSEIVAHSDLTLAFKGVMDSAR